MMLSKNGRIIIIDDDIVQAAPLIKALSFSKIPFTYHSENIDSLPTEPYDDVRLVFLDINLTNGVNENSIIAQLQQTIKRIIKPKTPYIVAIWSLRENEYVDLIEELFTNRIPELSPLKKISLAKSDFFQINDENNLWEEDPNVDIIAAINLKLESEVNNIDSFKAILAWERLVDLASKYTIHEFANIVERDEYWHVNLRNILYKMAHAQLGQNILHAEEKVVMRAALETLTGSFKNKMESLLNISENIPGDVNLKQHGQAFYKNVDGKTVQLIWNNLKQYILQIDNVQKAQNAIVSKLVNATPADNDIINKFKNAYKLITPKLNSEWLIDTITMPNLHPGNVYLKAVPRHKKRKLLKTYFENIDKRVAGNNSFEFNNLSPIKFIELECTPLCDFSQLKRHRTRLLPGIIYESSFAAKANKESTVYNEIPEFFFQNKIYKIVFDYRLFKSLNIEDTSIHPSNFLFKLNNDVLKDILARISSHINRPGITTIH